MAAKFSGSVVITLTSTSPVEVRTTPASTVVPKPASPAGYQPAFDQVVPRVPAVTRMAEVSGVSKMPASHDAPGLPELRNS